ncbi:ribosomal protection-like ABC-F family protein [Terriglobus tenax]|uniref:ribosomal protection-like ABC-F family protein n=1 Tax=Terriglobus tenax TaxID=1111115 RepID=UPI0021E0747E|nr:ABC-F family ATP-binding cassette domain-containing protein [Terriglobus tenax]
MLQLAAAGKRFGPKLLFDEANWLITARERTGLVGGNGTGKSTLLKTLAGMETLDYGALHRTKGMTLGYLPQDGLHLTGKTVFNECLTVFQSQREMEAELETLTKSMSELDPAGSEYAEVASRFSEINDILHTTDAYSLDAQVGAVLGGLGFSKTDWARDTSEFSGGWQMRIALAKLLLQRPSLLLLDEPTNHLDLESRNWLENYLKGYPHGFILISHDRYFLDVTVEKIVEVWNKRLHFFTGGYEKYVQQKAERKQQLEAAYKNQRDHIEQLEAFIGRFRYQATKAKQVQSRIKELDKIERIEIPEEESTIHFTFPQPPQSGRTVLEANGVSKAYGAKQVLDNVSFTIDRGDRIALVGANGAGKSTLIRLLSQLEPPTSGEIKLGHNVAADYFAQDQYKVLNPASKMLEDISASAPKIPDADLRGLLGCFLFSGDDVFKLLGVLSGGERNRYALAKMLVSPANFLLMDEPTNHLDLRAKDVLLEAIRSFTGTVVFVSHDRYFIDNLATRVFEVEGGHVHVYPGNYEDYLRRKDGQASEESAQNGVSHPRNARVGSAPPTPTQPQANQPSSTPSNQPTGAKRLNPIKLKQLEDRLATLEEEIPRTESAITTTETGLGNFVSAEETQRQTVLLAQLREQLQSLMQEWEELSLTLETQA